MRSLNEISFRIRQEIANVALLARPNKLPGNIAFSSPLPWLPAPSEIASVLRDTNIHREINRRARSVLVGRISVFGCEIETGSAVRWRRDYLSGIETGLSYFRRIPYLDAARVGDHKVIWELNRHQHLVLLAQAYTLDADPEFAREIVRQLDDWIDNNPFQRGINWASALEVAFRSLSWCWIFHLAGSAMEGGFHKKFLNALCQHGLHLEQNLSVYFSPNTHLLGETVALHALGCLFPQFPRSQRWVLQGARIITEQLNRQVHPDGSHFEQSTYYHVYALDMFLFHFILTGNYAEAHGALERMAAYLMALVAPDGELPLMGDDDGGRFFCPYGDRRKFGLATLATCGVLFNRAEWIYSEEAIAEQAVWWIGPQAFEHRPGFSQQPGAALFPDAGTLTLHTPRAHLLFDAGGFGPWSAGHSHSDALSIVLSCGSERTLVDPGTYSYCDAVWRDRFRGSAAHNTIRIDGLDQAVSIPPFAWKALPAVRIRHVEDSPAFYRIDGECAYSSFRHRRTLIFAPPDFIWVFDEISGPEGAHDIQQFWHPGEPVAVVSDHTVMIGRQAALTVDSGLMLEISDGWISDRFLHKHPAQVLCASARANLPCVCLSVIDLRSPFKAAATAAKRGDDGWILNYCGSREATFRLRDLA